MHPNPGNQGIGQALGGVRILAALVLAWALAAIAWMVYGSQGAHDWRCVHDMTQVNTAIQAGAQAPHRDRAACAWPLEGLMTQTR